MQRLHRTQCAQCVPAGMMRRPLPRCDAARSSQVWRRCLLRSKNFARKACVSMVPSTARHFLCLVRRAMEGTMEAHLTDELPFHGSRILVPSMVRIFCLVDGVRAPEPSTIDPPIAPQATDGGRKLEGGPRALSIGS